MSFHVPEKYRVKTGLMRSHSIAGNNGQFIISSNGIKHPLQCIASDAAGWEHVSVSLRSRCPTWDEMTFIKSLFWDEDDCVVQFHPAKTDHINNHPHCLHLWRPTHGQMPRPPSILVGVKT